MWRLLVLLIVLLLALPLGVLGLLASESGSAWLLRQAVAAARTQGIEIGFARSTGNLLRRLELDQLKVFAADTRIGAQRLVLQWRPQALIEPRLHVELLQIDGLAITPPPSADTEPAAPTLPDIQLPLAVQIDRLVLDGVRVEQPGGALTLNRVQLAAAVNGRGLQIAGLELAADGAAVEGDAQLQLSVPHALDGHLAAQIDERLSGADVGSVKLAVTLAGSALRPQIDLRVDAPATAHVRGTLQLDQVSPTFDLEADWPALAWPLQGASQVGAADGRLSLRGSADAYQLSLSTRLELPQLPAAGLQLQASGDQGGLQLEPLILRLPDGRLQADGALRWAQGVSWQLELLAERINPGLLAAEWPGEIGGRVAVEGSIGAGGDAGLAVAARIKELTGTLRGYPVSASGALDWRAGRLRADGLKLASGPNRVQLDGRADEVLDLGFAIQAPDLASLYPGLSGRLSGTGHLSGTPALPGVSATLSGGALAFEGMRAQALELALDWKAQGGSGRLQLSGVDAAGTELSRVTADVEGSPTTHRLNLAAEGPQGGIDLAAQGGLKEQVWAGELQRLTLQAPGLGEWRLRAPAALRLAAAAASTGPLCLAQSGAELCTRGGWDKAAGLDLSGTLRGFDLAGLAPYLPGEAVVEGRLTGEFSVSGVPVKPTVLFDLRPGNGHIRLEDAAQPFDLAFRNARIKGQFADDRGSAELGLELGPNGRATGKLTLGPGASDQRRLGGEIRADFPDLSLVAGFVPALDEVQGRLLVEATLAGTLAKPQVIGGLRVSDARARVPAAGILLDAVELALQGDGQTPLRLTGQAKSGEGRVDLSGSVDLAASPGPALDLNISGKNFEAARLPEATVLVSPELQLKGSGPYQLSGKLRIPTARIELKELPSGTVAVSDDEIVVGAEPVAPRAAAEPKVTARVRVELGDAVSFKGFGLDTRLVGAMDAVVDRRGTTVDGKIELRDGRYKAYGQDLTVERGRLLFAGPPGNPDVDLRAMRLSRDEQVKAYLAMSGPLSKPRPRVYSEPALPEAEALAYLLTGRGLDQAGQQEGVDIAGAALSLGLSRGEPLLQKLSDRLGLDDLRVESGANGIADSSLLLGKYLNPDLYLGYTQGLFNPEGAVLLRLRLSRRLEVESRSGTEQSVDLFYRLEHN